MVRELTVWVCVWGVGAEIGVPGVCDVEPVKTGGVLAAGDATAGAGVLGCEAVGAPRAEGVIM